MGVVPVIVQVVVFLLAGYFFGKSHSRTIGKNLILTAVLAFVFSVAIIMWTGTWGWTGIRFILLNVMHLTLFGGIGVGVGYVKAKWDIEQEEAGQ